MTFFFFGEQSENSVNVFHFKKKHLQTAQALMSVLFAFWFCSLFAPTSAGQQERRKWEEPQNLAIVNTTSDDFAPSYAPLERVLYSASTQSGYAELYIIKYETRRDAASGEIKPRFSAAERVQTSLNQPRTNQSYITFAKDGTVLLSAFRMAKTRPYLNIFQAADRSNIFSKPAPLDALNTDDFNAHASLAPSGRSVVFASTRTNGRGGTDLWTATRDESGAWQPPVNLGDLLNSQADEITPFLAAEDSLYYASNGFGGKGGFEIFLSVRIDGRWQAPVPLVELNSEADDSDFTLLPGNVAVFASNRSGGRGSLDLYISRFVPVSQLVSAVEYKIATQTNFLTLEEFSMTEVIPLAPYIFFEPNVSALPRDLKQYSADETTRYSPQNLRPDPMTVYSETLNIIGKRLAENPTSTLLLNVVESSNNALSRQRVEAIRLYLQNVWSIDVKRLLGAASNGTSNSTSNSNGVNTAILAATKRKILGFAGEDAVRCVELTSSDARICAPVRIAGVNVLAKPRKLDVALDARPRPAMRSWTFSLLGDSRDTLFRTSGVALPFAMAVPLEASAWGSVPEEVTARLVGTDSLGRTGKRELVMAVYRLLLDQKRAQKVQDKLIERYRLLVPRDNEGALTAEQQDILKEIASSMTGSTNVILSSYSFDDKSANDKSANDKSANDKSANDKSASTPIDRVARQMADELKRLAPILLTQPPQFEATTDVSTPETPQERVFAHVVIITIERNMQSSQQERRGR
jgi:WD40-like Beta Propeller Repeat